MFSLRPQNSSEASQMELGVSVRSALWRHQQSVVEAVAGRWILPKVFDTVNKFMHLLKGDCEKKRSKKHMLCQSVGLI